ncbi:MAG: acetylornithine carbamoyltransferase, partial [Thermoflexibacter sp.]|nr:acetylornithine carbamoyltransferase [Thermoflexibacter sp.]
ELDTRYTWNAQIEYNQAKAFEGAEFIYAKNWSSYSHYGKILSKDTNWTVSSDKMKLTNQAYFMHCLPVRRNVVVNDDVIDSPQSIIIKQAANRLWAAQAVLKQLLENIGK